MGEETCEEGERWKCPRGGDDFDDDKDEGWAGIGTGRKVTYLKLLPMRRTSMD